MWFGGADLGVMEKSVLGSFPILLAFHSVYLGNPLPVKFDQFKGLTVDWNGLDLQRRSPTTITSILNKFNHGSNTNSNRLKYGTGDHRVDPEVYMNVSELIWSKGYPVEEYTVPTKDGFLLGVQRIPRGRHDNQLRPRPVVFLQHGLLCSSTNWVSNLANESLAFLLADAGFDVWLGNVRGNVYSRRHKTLDPGEAEFWRWSWDEFASKDLPAMIDFALATSGVKHLYYVGHSQGTLIAFGHLSQDAAFRAKVRMFFALGPVSTASHVVGPIRLLAYLSPDINDLLKLLGVHEFLPNDKLMQFLASTFCDASTRFLCKDVIFLLAGFDTRNFNQSRLPVYIGHTPAGTSVRNMVHFSQMVRTGLFQMYDYGTTQENEKHYSQKTPPLYDVTKVTVPVVIFSGEKDWLADVEDVDLLAKKLPQLVQIHHIAEWNHLDFVWGMDAASVVYEKIINYIKQDMKEYTRIPDVPDGKYRHFNIPSGGATGPRLEDTASGKLENKPNAINVT